MNSPISSTWNHVSFLKTNKFTINAWGRLFRECLFEGSFKCLLYFVQIFLIFFIHSSISNSKSFLITTFYRLPINSTYLPSNFDNILNDQLSNASCEKKEIIVLGDFNTDLLKKDNKTIKDTFKLNGFTQLIKRTTRITKDRNIDWLDCSEQPISHFVQRSITNLVKWSWYGLLSQEIEQHEIQTKDSWV